MLPATAAKILDLLRRRYPRGRRPWSRRSDPYRTLIGTILSAQTTDDQVDRVTPPLFKKYPTPQKLAAAKGRDVQRIIKAVGLHQMKAANIVAASRMIIQKFGGRLPTTREDLIKLPGVGRKTANVVLIKAFGKPAMPVDTHVFRVATRIGLARHASHARHARQGKILLKPEDVERQLEEIIPKRNLAAAHFWMIHHGRTLCTARNPRCSECPIIRLCAFAKRM